MKKLAFRIIPSILCFLLMLSNIPLIAHAISTSGIVHWGYNGYSLSGIPGGLTNIREISAGRNHIIALKEDGTVVAWGNNDSGKASVPSGLTKVKAVSAGFGGSLALREDGSVVTWGFSWLPYGLTNIKAISAGKGSYSGVVREDGRVQVWGYDNEWGQLSVPSWLTDVKDLAIGTGHIVALKEDGTVAAWGDNTRGQASVPGGLTKVKAIAAGYDFTAALKEDGTVVTWGKDIFGKPAVPVPAGLSNVKAIAAGASFMVALKEDGTVAAWGSNSYGQTTVPAGLTDVKTIAAGSDYVAAFVQKQDYAAPTALTGVPPTAYGGHDGRITGVTTLMEYKLSTDTSYTKVSGLEVTGLSAGTYYVRNAAIPGYSAGLDAVVAIPSNASAEDYTYTISGNEAIITGYTGTGTDIAIPAAINGYPVTSIGESAFERKTTLKSVTIPNGVTSIGSYAFYGSTGIKSISFPSSVTSIGRAAFYGCYALVEARFYGNAPVMGENVFNYSSQYFTVYYYAGKTGYTNPWYGYPTEPFGGARYNVTYNGNENTGGTVPSDSKTYFTGQTGAVLGNTGSLAKVGYVFSGWNTTADGTGISYAVGDTISMGTENIVLYAKWTQAVPVLANNGHRYIVLEAGMTWNEAKQYCEKIGGHLATITSMEEQQLISQLISGGTKILYWIGLSDEKVEGTWEWVTDEKYEFTNWSSSEPNNYGGGEDYASIGTYQSDQWNDFNDNAAGQSTNDSGFVCEWDTDLKVTFNSNGGSPVASTTTYYNSIITKPTEPSKNGYIFEGWYKETEGINAWNFATDTLTADTTLYAKWTDVCDINKDGEVSILDLASISQNYNVRNTDTKWNSIFDFNKDGIVDIFDLVTSSRRMK